EVAQVRAGIRREAETARAEVRAIAAAAEIRVRAARVIETDVRAGRHPRVRTVVGVEAADEAVDLLVHGLLEDVARRERAITILREAERAKAVVLVARAAVRAGAETGRVVIDLRQALIQVNEAHRRLEVELGA